MPAPSPASASIVAGTSLLVVREHRVRGSAYRVESWHVGHVYLPPEDQR